MIAPQTLRVAVRLDNSGNDTCGTGITVKKGNRTWLLKLRQTPV